MNRESTTDFLDGGGQASAQIRAFDWATTPLGPLSDWPVSLKTAVGMMVASRFPKAIFWGPDLTMLHNEAFRPILGAKPPAIGRPMQEVWAEAWGEIGPIAQRAMRGESTYIEDFPLVIDRAGYPEQCYFTFCYSPIRDETGRVGGFIDTVIETTGKVEVERTLMVQNAELAHRIKNTLAIVSSIARQTLRAAETPAEAWKVLSNRLGALAETHNLLKQGRRPVAEIATLVEAALRPHRGEIDQFEVSGPAVAVPERHALALSLAVNELATNALKHGALSTDRGRITIDWGFFEAEGGQGLRFRWIERGGPAVVAPERRNFGSRLIEEVVPTDFGGEARLEFAPEGLRYELSCDLRRLAE